MRYHSEAMSILKLFAGFKHENVAYFHSNLPKCTCLPLLFAAYVRETGRAGRTGNTAHAVLFFNAGDAGVKGMTKDMKEYCKQYQHMQEKHD